MSQGLCRIRAFAHAFAAVAAALAGLGFAAVPFYVAEPLMAVGRFVPVLEDRMLDGASLEAVCAHRRHLAGKARAWFEVQPVR